MTYDISAVNSDEWQVIDREANVELCVCSTYEGEAVSAIFRAYTIANALNSKNTKAIMEEDLPNDANLDDVVDYIYCEDCGNGQFMIARSVKDVNAIVFVYLDKRDYFNVFQTMEEYTLYVSGLECKRICLSYEGFESSEEGVDPLDVWLLHNINNLNKAFEEQS